MNRYTELVRKARSLQAAASRTDDAFLRVQYYRKANKLAFKAMELDAACQRLRDAIRKQEARA